MGTWSRQLIKIQLNHDRLYPDALAVRGTLRGQYWGSSLGCCTPVSLKLIKQSIKGLPKAFQGFFWATLCNVLLINTRALQSLSHFSGFSFLPLLGTILVFPPAILIHSLGEWSEAGRSYLSILAVLVIGPWLLGILAPKRLHFQDKGLGCSSVGEPPKVVFPLHYIPFNLIIFFFYNSFWIYKRIAKYTREYHTPSFPYY